MGLQLGAPRALIGAVVGLATAIAWLAFDANAVLILVAFAAVGAGIGVALDRPDHLIKFLQRLQDR